MFCAGLGVLFRILIDDLLVAFNMLYLAQCKVFVFVINIVMNIN